MFSAECKSLISGSREMAINLGYDYISTIHIFLADCETSPPTSVKKFAFTDDTAYIKFKTQYTLAGVNYLDNVNDSIPLTKEAEFAIRLAEKERKETGSRMIFPCHIIIGCFKAENSILANCFRNDPNVVDKLMKYYKDLGLFESEKIYAEEIIGQQRNPFKSFLKIFKR